jgi:CheY-like chemotaxis protein
MANNSDSANILIVDDDADIQSVLREALEIEGYTVEWASNGKEALDFLEKGTFFPSLILLDVIMPILNGWDFLAALRKHPKFSGIPVVALSATESPRPFISAQAFSKKPFSLKEILGLISKHRT